MSRKSVPTLVVLLLAGPLAAAAQSVLQRTPNMSGGWSGVPGTVYFNFLHRFSVSEAPARQVTNFPTFLLGAGIPGNVLLAAQYATRSDVAAQYPNEWEFFVRAQPVRQSEGKPLDAALQAGYNLAGASVDGELSLGREFGRLRVLGAARAFTHAYDQDSMRFALAGGAALQLTRWLAVAGDVAQLLDASDREEMAWGAALQIAIPYTPHTLSLQVTNTNTMTLEGASRGGAAHRFGFEFTIPLHVSRYFGRSASTAAETPPDAAGAVTSRMRNLAFAPARIRIQAGGTIVWRNDDQMMHTVKAADSSWESPQMEPGGTYRHTFSQPGRYEITCGPHPFMKQIVEVR